MLRVRRISPSESLLAATESTSSSSGKSTYSLHPRRPSSLTSSRVTLRAFQVLQHCAGTRSVLKQTGAYRLQPCEGLTPLSFVWHAYVAMTSISWVTSVTFVCSSMADGPTCHA